MMTRQQIGHACVQELERAYGKHGKLQWGRHEFFGILKEEVDELWDRIKADDPQAEVEKEALQIAAMVFRYLETGDRYLEPSNNQTASEFYAEFIRREREALICRK